MSKVQVNIEIDADLLEKLDELVRVHKTSRDEIISGQVEWLTNGHGKIKDMLRKVIAEDTE